MKCPCGNRQCFGIKMPSPNPRWPRISIPFTVLYFNTKFVINLGIWSGYSLWFLLTLFFCMWMGSYSSTIYWKESPFPIEVPMFFYQRSLECICTGLFPGCYLDLPIFFCQYHTIYITVDLSNSLSNLSPLILFFFNTGLATLCLLPFHLNFAGILSSATLNL